MAKCRPSLQHPVFRLGPSPMPFLCLIPTDLLVLCLRPESGNLVSVFLDNRPVGVKGTNTSVWIWEVYLYLSVNLPQPQIPRCPAPCPILPSTVLVVQFLSPSQVLWSTLFHCGPLTEVGIYSTQPSHLFLSAAFPPHRACGVFH